MRKLYVIFSFVMFWTVQTNATDSSSVIERLQKDTEFLREIALQIFIREQDSTTLLKKMCLHSKTVLDFWGKTPMWDDLTTTERQGLKAPSEIPSRDWLRGLLRKDKISEFTAKAMEDYKDLTLTLIKKGVPSLTENKGQTEKKTKTYTIAIKYKFEHPVGNLLSKIKTGDKTYKIDPLPQYELLLAVDITKIVEALESHESYDLSTMGYISTICPN